MKLLGMVLIVLAGLGCGLRILGARRRHADMLRSCFDLVCRMEAELGSRATATPELLQLCSQQISGDAAAFCRLVGARMAALGTLRFEQIWREGAKNALPQLSKEEQREFCELGTVLGRYAVEEQVAALERCRAYLDSRMEWVWTRYLAERKLAMALPLSGALFIILVLA